ncbi:hypothetical protein HHI36_023568 [Cryptolaemus montrouzieri]|uniref:Peptidase S1 domain-containing protein n=1 Tax=Cryptolaemus montrouzieri TaxID=559131 RepID=A0ABD2PGS2_9CUCU
MSNDPGVVALLRKSVCGYEGNTPLVWCPAQRAKTPDTNNNFVDPVTSAPQYESTTEQITRNAGLLRKPNCGFSNITNSRIVGGVPAKLGEFPWMVALGYRNKKNPSVPQWLCGASLISDRHLLTAAHCVYGRSDLYLARIGDLDLYSDDDGASPEDILLESARVHEDFIQARNDIAVLKLSRRVTNPTVWPICLPVEDSLRTRSFVGYRPVVAGWGSIYFQGPSSSALLEVGVDVVTTADCKAAHRMADDNVICAGFQSGGKDSCKGDSGGPLMHIASEPNNLRITQIGVVSYGFKCAEPGYPGVYTRVSKYIDWIEKNML